ncbi:MAG TPA: DUF1254 domain-containing protein [Accumulibacter sp.]|nr:DUF1254 domain-containing protein [Accumulibacter sp.]
MERSLLQRAVLALALLTMFVSTPGRAQELSQRSTLEAQRIGVEAAIYGLPLVLMDLTRQLSTNVPSPQANAHAPINQFGSMSSYPPASDHSIVRMNVDTLYSFAWLDLANEPMVLSVPDTGERYYLMPMLDAWTNVFASPGKRTSGTQAGNFVITGPDWSGTLPEGVEEIKAPTNTVWIAGRTQTNGARDYAAVHRIQKQYRITPLSAFGKRYTPPTGVVDTSIESKLAPVDQLAQMDTTTFFNRLAQLMAANPPPAADAPLLDRLARIGLIPGEKFTASKLDPAVARGLEGSLAIALERLHAAAKHAGKPVNGWYIPPREVGDFGTDYDLRAVVALIGLGANIPADAIYPNAFTDGDGKPLNGAQRYVIHFDKGQTPPANAFWSLTMYDAQSFFVDNPVNRYNVASWMPLRYNRDGSLDVFIQKESPGKGKEANWLPAASGDFSVTMRVYWPKEEMLDGSWSPPALKRLD